MLVSPAVVDPPPPTTPPGTSQVIVNGGFEDGPGPWVQSAGNGHDLIGPHSPHSGDSAALLGGYNGASDTIYQTITVPANGTLTYWWRMTTPETTATARDRLRVRLYTTGDALVATLRTHSNADGADTWHQEQISLAGHAGRTLRLRFTATTDRALPTSFFVDDVGVQEDRLQEDQLQEPRLQEPQPHRYHRTESRKHGGGSGEHQGEAREIPSPRASPRPPLPAAPCLLACCLLQVVRQGQRLGELL